MAYSYCCCFGTQLLQGLVLGRGHAQDGEGATRGGSGRLAEGHRTQSLCRRASHPPRPDLQRLRPLRRGREPGTGSQPVSSSSPFLINSYCSRVRSLVQRRQQEALRLLFEWGTAWDKVPPWLDLLPARFGSASNTPVCVRVVRCVRGAACGVGRMDRVGQDQRAQGQAEGVALHLLWHHQPGSRVMKRAPLPPNLSGA